MQQAKLLFNFCYMAFINSGVDLKCKKVTDNFLWSWLADNMHYTFQMTEIEAVYFYSIQYKKNSVYNAIPPKRNKYTCVWGGLYHKVLTHCGDVNTLFLLTYPSNGSHEMQPMALEITVVHLKEIVWLNY